MKRSQSTGRRRNSEAEPEQVLYFPEGAQANTTVHLDGPEAQHAQKSLRLRSGDPVVLVDGKGERFHGVIQDMGKRSFEVSIERIEALTPWPSPSICLAAGVLRTSRMDWLVEKASELGAGRFVPLIMDRSVAKPSEGGSKVERWRRIAVESLKQCKRSHLLQVEEPQGLEAFLESLTGEPLFFAEPSGEPLQSFADPAPAVTLVVGPEGGISEIEQGQLV
ncbi:MAG: 16S rRNA (uracil(1498)-N(3))-methyltransferase, partial [Candidatus Eisenbacteria bacterium]|nr:16S rRNA (uracil(1498)-N(3))-methyltransferase [Candidatus Eisenbacteria bacterium]